MQKEAASLLPPGVVEELVTVLERIADFADDFEGVVNIHEVVVIVFVSVSARRNSDSFPQEHVNEEELEGFAISWLKDNRDHAACAIRFDHIGLLLISPDRALIKHHINVMSCSDIPEEE